MRYFFLILVVSPLAAQTELHLPWFVENDTFTTQIHIINYGDRTAEVKLLGTRPDGRQAGDTIRIHAFQTSIVRAFSNFRRMRTGPGFTVKITSDSDHLTATAIISSKTTLSDSSPSLVHAIPAHSAANTLVYNFIPTNTDQIAAPVTVNLGIFTANVTFKAFLDGVEVGQYRATIKPEFVFAKSSADMFPDLVGNIYVIAESDQPILGTSFIFNELREPSMAQAQPFSISSEP